MNSTFTIETYLLDKLCFLSFRLQCKLNEGSLRHLVWEYGAGLPNE